MPAHTRAGLEMTEVTSMSFYFSMSICQYATVCQKRIQYLVLQTLALQKNKTVCHSVLPSHPGIPENPLGTGQGCKQDEVQNLEVNLYH